MSKVILYSAASEKGSRKSNQDNLGITGLFPCAKVENPFSTSGQIALGDLRVFSVCDGIGGAAMGELASRNALMGVAQYMLRKDRTEKELPELLLGAAEEAQRHVRAMYDRLRSEGGCTLTMLAVRDDSYAFLNIGDSPAFILREETKELEELSFRQNLAGIKASKGLPVGYGDECCLVNYIGKNGSAVDMAFVSSGVLKDEDRILLCSDGVTNAFTNEELHRMLSRETPAEELVKLAAQIRHADNCTAISLKLTS